MSATKSIYYFYTLPIRSNILTGIFHDFLTETLRNNGYSFDEPVDWDEFYGETLPNLMYDLYSLKGENEKFDAIIVDEGQDFKENWYFCLDQMVKEDGHFYIFADRHQNLFGNGLDSLKDFQMSKHKLTINLRNTQKIYEWCQPLIGNTKLRYRLSGGMPVEYFGWKDYQDEKRLVEKELSKLISQGLSPHKITILSTHRKEKSSLKDINKIGTGKWPIVQLGQSNEYRRIVF